MSSWRRWTSGLGWTLTLLATVGFIVHLWRKVANGEGLETYFTGFGVQFNYIGAAILFGLVPFVLLAGAILNWWLGRDERDFKRRYGVNDDEPPSDQRNLHN